MPAARMLGGCLLTLALVALAAGCQRPAALNPVSGKVSYRGMVLQSGVIVFTPDTSRGESGRIALGTIRPDGTYTLAMDAAEGAPAGWYRVTVAAFAPPPPGAATGAPLLPEKYRDPQLSMLNCEVKPDRSNRIDFNLD
jgi:hypothetical protein